MTPYRFSSPSDRGRGSYAWSSRPTRACNGSPRGSAAQAGARHEDAAAAGATSPDCVVSGRRVVPASTSSSTWQSRVRWCASGVGRWSRAEEQLRAVEKEESDSAVQSRICEILADAPRSGRPADILPEQILEIVAIACEDPNTAQRPISHWTPAEVAREAVCRGIIKNISTRSVDRFFKRRSTLDRTACATGCTWTTPTTRRSMPPPNRSVTCTGVLRSFTTVEFTSCAATRRPESRPWRGRLHPTSPFLGLSSGRMLTTFAMAHVR